MFKPVQLGKFLWCTHPPVIFLSLKLSKNVPSSWCMIWGSSFWSYISFLADSCYDILPLRGNKFLTCQLAQHDPTVSNVWKSLKNKLKCLIFYCLKLLLIFAGAPPFGSEKKTVPLPSFTQPLWEGVHGGIHLAIVVASLGEVTGQPVAAFCWDEKDGCKYVQQVDVVGKLTWQLAMVKITPFQLKNASSKGPCSSQAMLLCGSVIILYNFWLIHFPEFDPLTNLEMIARPMLETSQV